MTYDPKIDCTVERIVGRLKGDLARKNGEIVTAMAERDAIQNMLTAAETIIGDEKCRIERETK